MKCCRVRWCQLAPIYHRVLRSCSPLGCPNNSFCSSPKDDSSHFVTTPIFYVNAAPHIGHLYCALLADATNRWQAIKKYKTLFSTGTDEHGLKIQHAAASSGMAPQSYCDAISDSFKSMFDAADIKYDAFIRTSDPAHKEAVCTFWNRLLENGHIYKGTYQGWYSISDEAFLMEEEVEDKLLPDGSTAKVSKQSGHPVTWTEESNYKFRLSDFQQDLLHWVNSGAIYPRQYEQEVRQMLQALPDLSVTRDSKRLTWGIPVPGDQSQTIYVWLDALVNYLTVAGYPHKEPTPWPPDCQIIGKDILKFHAIYWPAFLIAADMRPPSRLVCHSHWLVDNVKMSKSLGNVVDPMEKMAQFGVEGLRYFLLKEGSLSSDGTYSDKRLVERVNSDLANTLGNLLGRCTAPSVNKQQELPVLKEDHLYEYLSLEERAMYEDLYKLHGPVDHLFSVFQYPKAIDLIMSHLHSANILVQSHTPWLLCKSSDPYDYHHLMTVLHVTMETLRVCGILLQPVVPRLAERLLTRLGVPARERFLAHTQAPSREDLKLGQKIILQKKLNLPEE